MEMLQSCNYLVEYGNKSAKLMINASAFRMEKVVKYNTQCDCS